MRTGRLRGQRRLRRLVDCSVKSQGAKQDCGGQLLQNKWCFAVMAKDDANRWIKCMNELQVL
jgi:hypothetical protein